MGPEDNAEGGAGRGRQGSGAPGNPPRTCTPNPSPAAPRGRPAPSGWDTPLGSAPGTVTDTLGRLGSPKARSAHVTSSAAARWSLPAPRRHMTSLRARKAHT